MSCVLCRFTVHMDDAWLTFSSPPPRCICIRCFERVTGITAARRARVVVEQARAVTG